ncbi:MAG: hypothetical protein ABR915_14555 [Thermoguttaceae bacterium]|jgi:hypothetical protein
MPAANVSGRLAAAVALMLAASTAAWLGLQYSRVSQVRRATREVERLGGYVFLSDMCDETGCPNGPFETPESGILPRLEALVGRDWFYNVAYVRLTGTAVSDDDLALLRLFPDVRAIDLKATAVTDAGMRYLRPLRNLRFVELGGTRVTEDGFRGLQSAIPGVKSDRDFAFERERAFLRSLRPSAREDGGLGTEADR